MFFDLFHTRTCACSAAGTLRSGARARLTTGRALVFGLVLAFILGDDAKLGASLLTVLLAVVGVTYALYAGARVAEASGIDVEKGVVRPVVAMVMPVLAALRAAPSAQRTVAAAVAQLYRAFALAALPRVSCVGW